MAASPLPGDDDLEHQSGLGRSLVSVLEQRPARPGRGVAALFGGEMAEAPALDPVLLHDVAGAVLAGLEQSIAPELCAYVHDAGERPTLHLRTPALAELTPDAAFWLFAELRGRLHGLAEDPLDAAGFRGLTVRVAGDATAGVFAVARRTQLTDVELTAVRSYCQTFGGALHQPVLATDEDAAPGDDASIESVARAALLAEDPRLAFRYVGARVDDDRHVALVLMEGPDNRAGVAQATGDTRSGAVTAAARAAARSL